MFKAYAKLVYDPKHDSAKRKGFQSWWLKADVHPSIVRYYRYWLQREWGVTLNSALWGPHITVVRGEAPRYNWFWKKYEGRKVEFSYSPDIQVSPLYAWLKVESPELEAIRIELGLAPQPRVPFHATLGNRKNLEKTEKVAAKLPFQVFPFEDEKIVEQIWKKQY